MNLLNENINKLGYSEENGLFYFHNTDSWQTLSPRIKHIIYEIKPFAFYCINEKPFILFFTEPKSEKQEKEIHKKVWNFQPPVIFIVKNNSIVIYNGYSLNTHTELLDKLASDDDVDKFSFWNITSGKTWIEFREHFRKKRIDDFLLENIQSTINELKNSKAKPFANLLLLRVIFIRYLIDRGVDLAFKGISGSVESVKAQLLVIISDKDKLYDLFDHLKRKFNGNLFELFTNKETGQKEKDIITQRDLNIIAKLLKGRENIKTGQLSLFDLYDFNIIPVELISNIYERFLGVKKQKDDGAFYTPSFIVDYVLKYSIEPFLNNNKYCKVLDPACGSGIFVVEALRRIIENNLNKRKYFDNDNELASYLENVYGIDKNPEAIYVAIFSLYITILDYKDPKTLRGFKFPLLYNKTFFAGDFFDDEIRKKLAIIKFDYIIGNPPWGNIIDSHLDYCRKENIPVHRNEIARSFLARVKDFSTNKTECALVVTSKILYNTSAEAKNFRINYFLKNFRINQVFELSPVRHHIFQGAVGPAAIIFYKYDTNNVPENKITHISLKPNLFFKYFKLIVIEKYDFKKIPQRIFIEYDWAWKVFVYGNILDFYFIKRLKSLGQDINEVIKSNNLMKGQGVQIGGGDSNPSTHLKGKPLLESQKHFQRYVININKKAVFVHDCIHRPRNPKLFDSPYAYALLKKGFDVTSFQLCSAFYDKEIVFTDSVTAIKGTNKDISLLKNLVGLFNSKLFSYYLLATGSSAGIEREQGHNEDERFTFPVVIHDEISQRVNEIQNNCEESINTIDNGSSLRIKNKEGKLEELLIKLYSVDTLERDLIDYTLNISIPIFNKESHPYDKLKGSEFKPYIDVFTDHFSEIFNEPNKHLQIDVYPQLKHHYSAIEFKIVKNRPKEIIDYPSQNKVIEAVKRFSVEKQNQYFFIQKDIINFEKESFFIIKPNEYKNWHPAIAHLDLGEVIESLFTATKSKE